MIRLLEQSHSKYTLREGDSIEANYRGRGKWFPGKISHDRGNDTFDVIYADGEIEKNVPLNALRLQPNSEGNSGIETIAKKRLEYFEKAFQQELEQNPAKYQRGHRVACYWYKSSKFSISKHYSKPKPATVLRYNIDGTYTVEMENDNFIIDDVPEDYLKDWTVATNDLILSNNIIFF